MGYCININTNEFKSLLKELNSNDKIGLSADIKIWQIKNGTDNFPTKEELLTSKTSKEINYTLKSVDILQSEKAKQVFDKGKKNNWDLNKILTELTIPKEQKQLILDMYNNMTIYEDKVLPLREQLALELASNYSYTVEIETAKSIKGSFKEISDRGENPWEFGEEEQSNLPEATPTQHYFNLSSPGGSGRNKYEGNPDWEYQELEFKTPLITPSIKGHAKFATDKGIGWARIWYNKKTGVVEIQEIQSDLFQKGRNRELLIPIDKKLKDDTFIIANIDYYVENEESISTFRIGNNEYLKIDGSFVKNNEYIKKEEFSNAFKEYYNNIQKNNKNNELSYKIDSKNQFLQLLNKDNNWVTFFIKSIIQDSAKKGYEKVLFPRLDTIIQIESQNRFKTYAEAEAHYKDEKWKLEDEELRKTLKEYQEEFENRKIAKKDTKEIEQAIINQKERIRSHQPTLLNTANFYEYELANRLDDIAGGNKNNRVKGIWALNQITDEYGNTWNEVTINNKVIKETSNILFNKSEYKEINNNPNIQAIPLRGNEKLYEDYKLLNNKGEIKRFENNKKTQEFVESLNQSPYYSFILRKTIGGNRILIFNKALNQLNLFNKSVIQTEKQNNETSLTNKYFKDGSETKATDVLSVIANSNHQLALLAKRFLNHSKYNDVKVILDDVTHYDMGEITKNPAYIGDKSNGYYNPNDKTIHIARWSNFTPGEVEVVLLHEILHSLTKSKLRDSSEVTKDFNKLYKYAYEQLSEQDKKLYAISNLDEFMVALFTNKVFIGKLMAIKASDGKKYSNLFEEIIAKILKLFNISKTNSLYEEAMAVASHVINDATEANQALVESVEAEENVLFSKKDDVKPPQSKSFEKQYVFIKRRISRLEKQIENPRTSQDEKEVLEIELKEFKKKFEEAVTNQSKEAFVEIAKGYLNWVETFSNNLPTTADKYVLSDLTDAFNILDSFEGLSGELQGKIFDLKQKLYPYVEKNNLKLINEFNSTGDEITIEQINAQDKDIGAFAKTLGSLSDVANYIASAIANVIKRAQNNASTKNKLLEAVIQKEVDELAEYAKNNNTTMEQVYDIFIQTNDRSNTLELTKRYNNGVLNPNYNKIQDTPELKKFYDFYKRILYASESQLPYKVGNSYILNKVKSDLKSDLKSIVPIETIQVNGFTSNEELMADQVPDMFRANIPADKKSRDLGSGLLEFAAYANNHAALAEVLPQVRLLQFQLKYRQEANGNVVERHYIKSADDTKGVLASDSNVYQMADTVIDMQVKGKMKDAKWKPWRWNKKYDVDGNLVSFKQLRKEDLIDKVMKLNGLLRIGWTPISAFGNVLIGDIGNFMEGVGGRFYTVREWGSANAVFFKQINYTSVNKDSVTYKMLKLLNPLQEMEDYDLGSGIKLNSKKIDVDKALETAYFMQKKGELYLQTTTMLAVLMHDGYLTKDGKETSKKMSETDIVNMTNKIQKLNQTIHGRYSQREAATIQQHVIARAALQFRKWIPAFWEARMGDYNPMDSRLRVATEGRYITYKNKFFTPLIQGNIAESFGNLLIPILSSKAALERGNMSELEIYNMRKNMVELILLSAFTLMAAGLRGDDDDKEWRRKPLVKSGLTMLNRISKDLLFFYNPDNVTDIAKNAIPLTALMKDLSDVVVSLPHAVYLGDYEVKRGSRKGLNEFYAEDLVEVIPFISTIGDLQKLLNDKDLLKEY